MLARFYSYEGLFEIGIFMGTMYKYLQYYIKHLLQRQELSTFLPTSILLF
jgi:hypothetical protein